MSDKKQVFLSLETAKKMYKDSKGNKLINLFLLENFTKEELESDLLLKNFEELKRIKGFYVSSASDVIKIDREMLGNDILLFKNAFPTKELAEASLALSQLLQLRDVYNGSWKVDLNNRPAEERYYIKNQYNNIAKYYTNHNGYNYILTFQKESIRDEFVENFEDLIITALPLL